MGPILNLTQHTTAPDQVAAGVIEPEDKGLVKDLLTFDSLEDACHANFRAVELADYAATQGCYEVMIGGAPYLMSSLEKALHDRGMRARYAFSLRASVDEVQKDGSVIKRTVFKHAGWVFAS